MKSIILFSALVVLIFFQCAPSSTRDGMQETQSQMADSVSHPLAGMYLFIPGTDTDQFFKDCKAWGVNMVFTNSAYWNQDFVDKARKFNMDLALLFPVFFNQEYLEAHPEDYCITSKGDKAIKDWLHFGCPSSQPFREHQKQYLQETLSLLDPEMVALDFIRFYVHWERVTPDISFQEIEDGCYCPRCLKSFEHYSGISMQGKSPDWIRQHALRQWTEWKCQLIEATVAEFSGIVKQYDSDLPVGIKTVPWKSDQHEGAIRSIAGQDLKRLSEHADFFMPMTYNHLLKEKPAWITDLLSEVHRITQKDVYATVQLEKVFPEQDNINEQEFKTILDQGVLAPSKGVVLFHYVQSEDNNRKANHINTSIH